MRGRLVSPGGRGGIDLMGSLVGVGCGAGFGRRLVAKPTIASISPAFGSTAGDSVPHIVTGTGFGSVAASGAVKIGGSNCTYTVDSPTQITITGTPAKAAGAYDLTVTNSGGTSPPLTNGYTAFAMPFVSLVGASTVTLSVSNISALADQSGNGNNALQATAAVQPTYLANWSNGKPAMVHATSHKYLRTAAFAGGDKAQPNTVICVVQQSDTAVRAFVDGLTANHRQVVYGDTLNSGSISMYAGTILTSSTTSTTSPMIVTSKFNDTTSKMRKNGTQIASGAGGAQPLDGLTIGEQFALADTVAWRGNIAAVLVFNSLLSDADCLAVERWLGSYYGITTA